jgi:anti-sigma factor RsiW
VTPEQPPSAHLGLDQLADLEEGLLAPGDEEQSRAHLDTCETCQRRHADIRTTRALLTTLPTDPMPAAVADRIDTALASLPPATVLPLGGRRRGWRSHPTAAGLGAAATVAALVAAVVIGKTHHSSSPSDSSQAVGAAGAQNTTRAALALPPSQASGTTYTSKNAARTVPQLLAPSESAAVAPSSPTPQTLAKVQSVPAALTRLYGTPAALEDCVRAVESGSAPVTPLAIDFATYAGTPAVLIVLPGLQTGKIDAWFVGPECGTASDAHLLQYQPLRVSPASPSPG